MRRIAPVAGFILIFALSGCSSLRNYTLQTAPARLSVSQGDFQKALAMFPEELTTGKDEILFRLERGMLLQCLGLFEQSSAEFESAASKAREYKEKAVISASQTASQAGTLLINEQIMPYEGHDFEIIMLHALNAMNYLMRGDLEGARVEVRRSYERQKQLSERHEKELDEARKEPRAAAWERSFELSDPQAHMTLKEKASGVWSVYHNAFASYISALVYELGGEPDEAYIDLKNAYKAYPSCPAIRKDLVRLSRKLGFRQDQQNWEEKFGPTMKMPKDGIDVFVVFSYGNAPSKVPLNIPIPTSHGFVFASLPVYRFNPSSIWGGRVTAAGMDEETSTVFDVDAVAARSLMDDFPVIFVKQIARSYLKAQATSRLAKDHGAGGALLGTLFAAVTEHADLRAWSMLPKEIQVARLFVPKTALELSISSLPAGGSATVQIPRGASHMVVYVRAAQNGLVTYTNSF